MREEANATPEELIALGGEDDVLPNFSRIAAGKDVKEFAEELGVRKEAKTALGRGAERTGKFVGSGTVFGAPAAVPSLLAGATGQIAEELNAPPWAQAAIELLTFIKASPRSATPLTSKTPVVQQQIERLRKLGFDEKDLTLAKNALEEHGWLTKASKLTGSVERKIADTTKKIESTIGNVIEESIPGLKKGE